MSRMMARGMLLAALGALVLSVVGCRHTASGVERDTRSNVDWVEDRF